MNIVIPIDLYRRDLMLHFGSISDLQKELTVYLSPLQVARTIEEMDAPHDPSDVTGYTMIMDTGEVILWMPDVPHSHRQYATLAHEIFHAATMILQKAGVQLTENSEEAAAYLIGYITEKTLDALNPYKSQESCQILQ